MASIPSPQNCAPCFGSDVPCAVCESSIDVFSSSLIQSSASSSSSTSSSKSLSSPPPPSGCLKICVNVCNMPPLSLSFTLRPIDWARERMRESNTLSSDTDKRVEGDTMPPKPAEGLEPSPAPLAPPAPAPAPDPAENGWYLAPAPMPAGNAMSGNGLGIVP